MSNTDRITIQDQKYQLIKDYKDQDKYRQSMNRLTDKIFGFNFENWYQQGYWSDKYRPYSLLHNDEVVANVSVNPIDFLMDGTPSHTVQIGTVMTDEAYRHKGLSRKLMELVLHEYENQCELFYLYASNFALDFYPKFGFEKGEEYIYTKSVRQTRNRLRYRKLNLMDKEDRNIITRLAVNTKPVSKYQMTGNPQLVFFYLTSYMANDIYYFEDIDLAAVVMKGQDNFIVADLFCTGGFDMDEMLGSLAAKDGTKFSLGFTPVDTSSFACERYFDEGTTFFVKGICRLDKGRFPMLSHA